MCGIVGILNLDSREPVARETLSAMCGAIVHRGPDDEGLLLDGNLGMGMRRLSIIDLAGGHQPVFNEDQTVAVVFNGEIYNYLELRSTLERTGHIFRTRSDTEVLVHGYEEWGTDLPRRLNGMFAFSLWDSRGRRLFIARDQVGVKPLYIYDDGRVLAWASEIKALLKVPGITASLDGQALVDFLACGYVPAPRTMFRGIQKLPPATQLTVDGNARHCSTYWDLNFPAEHRRVSDWCDELQSLIDDAVKRQLMSDVPLGAFLSGGLDSSTIVATMRRLAVGQISTYSIGFGGDDAFHSELDDARRTARLFETDHHEIVVEPSVADLFFPLVRHLDEPITDTSFLVTFLVSRLARETVKVILSGVGGDEVFAGYRRYVGPRLARFYGVVPGPMHRRVLLPMIRMLPVDRGSAWKAQVRYMRGFLEHAELPEADRYQRYVGIFDDGLVDELGTEEFKSTLAGYQSNVVADQYREAPASDPLNRMLYTDLKTSLVDSLLAFTDKMSMAVSLEARVPLLDYRLLELAARIPSKLKLRGLRGLKHIFKLAMRDRLPGEILHRRKRGFGTPISRWLRGALRPLACDLLSEDRIRARGYFRPEAVQKLLGDHLAQRADRSEHLLALLTFEVWHQIYLDGGRG